MNFPGGVTSFCARIYGVTKRGQADNYFRACLGFEIRAFGQVESGLRTTCFRFGPQGLGLEPAPPLPPDPVPPIAQVGDYDVVIGDYEEDDYDEDGSENQGQQGGEGDDDDDDEDERPGFFASLFGGGNRPNKPDDDDFDFFLKGVKVPVPGSTDGDDDVAQGTVTEKENEKIETTTLSSTTFDDASGSTHESVTGNISNQYDTVKIGSQDPLEVTTSATTQTTMEIETTTEDVPITEENINDPSDSDEYNLNHKYLGGEYNKEKQNGISHGEEEEDEEYDESDDLIPFSLVDGSTSKVIEVAPPKKTIDDVEDEV